MQPIDITLFKLAFDEQAGNNLYRSSFNTTNPSYTATQDLEAIEWASEKINKEAMAKRSVECK